jgi:hypothetical protein
MLGRLLGSAAQVFYRSADFTFGEFNEPAKQR